MSSGYGMSIVLMNSRSANLPKAPPPLIVPTTENQVLDTQASVLGEDSQDLNHNMECLPVLLKPSA